MSEQKQADATSETEDTTAPAAREPGRSTMVVLIIALAFMALILVKVIADGNARPQPGAAAEGSTTADTTITSARNDATADYQAALETGKPIYVLFHSLS